MRLFSFLMLCWATLLFLGCGDPKTGEQTAEQPPQHEEAPHGHDHGDTPHGGTLIELGDEEYHAEMVHDPETGTVTVYILDSKVENAVPIDAQEVTISAKSQTYPLESQPQESDPQGKSSRFVSSDKTLNEYIAGDDVHARLILKIGGRSYNGAINIHRD
jgi:hypothetical protein